MATDGTYTTGIPVTSNLIENDLPEISENWDYIRRQWMETGIVPIHGATIAYTYTGDKLTSLAFGGTLAGSATFTYTGDNLTSEVWVLYTKTITITHTYSGYQLTGSSVSIT
jgi:hypothetical protein